MSIKIYVKIKISATCFGVITSSGIVLCELAKDTMLKQLVKIHHCG